MKMNPTSVEFVLRSLRVKLDGKMHTASNGIVLKKIQCSAEIARLAVAI